MDDGNHNLTIRDFCTRCRPCSVRLGRRRCEWCGLGIWSTGLYTPKRRVWRAVEQRSPSTGGCPKRFRCRLPIVSIIMTKKTYSELCMCVCVRWHHPLANLAFACNYTSCILILYTYYVVSGYDIKRYLLLPNNMCCAYTFSRDDWRTGESDIVCRRGRPTAAGAGVEYGRGAGW